MKQKIIRLNTTKFLVDLAAYFNKHRYTFDEEIVELVDKHTIKEEEPIKEEYSKRELEEINKGIEDMYAHKKNCVACKEEPTKEEPQSTTLREAGITTRCDFKCAECQQSVRHFNGSTKASLPEKLEWKQDNEEWGRFVNEEGKSVDDQLLAVKINEIINYLKEKDKI